MSEPASFLAGDADVPALRQAIYRRARASLYPVGDRLIFSDHAWPELPHPGFSAVPYNRVMAVGLDSRHLARATIRKPVHSALDLCAGSEVHALLAAAHAQRVLAVGAIYSIPSVESGLS